MSLAQPTSDRLQSNLLAQQAAAQELEGLLASERERLVARDWAALSALSVDKNRAVQRLQNLHRDLLHVAGNTLTQKLDAAGLSRDWHRLLDQAQRLQNANREIRVLLDRQRDRTDAALRLLNRDSGAPATYGRLGLGGLSVQRQRLASA